MHKRLRQARTAVRERGASCYARLAAAGGFGSVDVIVTKATSPNDMPLREKYVQELLKVFSISGQASLRRFSLSFTRRFGRTKSWRVALKCLLLLHRLLRSTPTTPGVNLHFRAELLWSRANGLISLHPCRFTDESSSNSAEFTAFVRSYSHFLDEALSSTVTTTPFDLTNHIEVEHQDTDGNNNNKSLSEKMKEVGRVLELLPELQSLNDRVMECHPAGSAARSFVVKAAMKALVRDSFCIYEAFQRDIVVVLDTLFQMPYSSCVKGFGVYKRASVQNDKLSEFYGWCKETGLCGAYEYPFVERIPWVQIQALERFFNGMWQFSDNFSSASSSSSSPSSKSESCWGDIDKNGDHDDDNKNKVLVAHDGSNGNHDKEWFSKEEKKKKKKKIKFCSEEEEPLLIQSEDNNDDEDDDDDESWETLLDASVSMSPYNGIKYNNNNNNDNEYYNRDPYNNHISGMNPFNHNWVYNNVCPPPNA